MRIVIAELLVPTAEEIRNLVQRVYDAGYTRGREKAKRLVGSPDGAGFEAPVIILNAVESQFQTRH